jgi:hypothetical protein
MYESNPKYFLCEILEHNISEEAKARAEYYRILESFERELSESEKAEIEEIISEELKHSEILARMVVRRSRIKAER